MADGLWFDYNKQDIATKAKQNESTAKAPNSAMDKDAFLKLMITQMQHQDPLSPMDDKEFLSQMAQFTTLEQTQNMVKTNAQSHAFGMIGKTIEASVKNSVTGSQETVLGVVSSVTMKSGEAVLLVDGKEVPANAVATVYTDPITNLNTNMSTSQSFNLIGKVVQAITVDATFNATGFVEGKVDYVKFDAKGGTILVVGDKEIFPKEVVSVGENNMLIGREINAVVKDSTGNMVTITKPVEGINIKDGKAYLQMGGYEAEIEKINYATDALALVGKTISYSGVRGAVESVTIREGKPYMNIAGKEVSFTDFKGISPASNE